MAELRKDPVSGRWVIVDTENSKAPDEYHTEGAKLQEGACPFCYNNEKMTPPEIDVFRKVGTHKNAPGWIVRAVPNKFPALQIEGDLNRNGVGMYDMSNGIGAHEVIIETPDHNKNFADLSCDEIAKVIEMYCRRSLDLQRDKRFKYILIFRNSGFSAGASLNHPHSQLIALPMIPKNVLEELEGAQTYFRYKDRCIFCDIIQQEKTENERIVTENKSFIAFCYFASRFPFEVHILPLRHQAHFCRMDEEKKLDLASILKDTMTMLARTLNDPSYNFILHTAPVDVQEYDYYHWHIEIIPRLKSVTSLEWGTELFNVSTSPEAAATFLKTNNHN